jgi:hypothetical protein
VAARCIGSVYVWSHTSGRTDKIMITHEVADLVPPEQNPVMQLRDRALDRFRRDDIAAFNDKR